MPVISNNGIQATCPETLNCLVLVQTLTSLNRLHVGFIDSSSTSTNVLVDTFSNDSYVVVYSWESEQSVFDGKVSLFAPLNSLNSKCSVYKFIIPGI